MASKSFGPKLNNLATLCKRINTMQMQADDPWSYTVTLDGLPYVTGLASNEVSYYKRRLLKRLMKNDGY
jgi:hypothetical protein